MGGARSRRGTAVVRLGGAATRTGNGVLPVKTPSSESLAKLAERGLLLFTRHPCDDMSGEATDDDGLVRREIQGSDDEADDRGEGVSVSKTERSHAGQRLHNSTASPGGMGSRWRDSQNALVGSWPFEVGLCRAFFAWQSTAFCAVTTSQVNGSSQGRTRSMAHSSPLTVIGRSAVIFSFAARISSTPVGFKKPLPVRAYTGSAENRS